MQTISRNDALFMVDCCGQNFDVTRDERWDDLRLLYLRYSEGETDLLAQIVPLRNELYRR